MTAEHEQRCERTIASVVHEIDDLNHQLREERRDSKALMVTVDDLLDSTKRASAEIERLAVAAGFALGQTRKVVDMYRHLQMDTPKDQELHRKVTAAADTAIDTALAVLAGRASIASKETT